MLKKGGNVIRFLLLSCFATFSILSFAQTAAKPLPVSSAPKSTLSLQQLLQKGFSHNTDWVSARSTLKQMQAEQGQAESRLFPEIDLKAEGRSYKDPVVFTTTGINLIAPTNRELYLTYLQLDQTLYKGGLLSNGLALKRSQVEKARQDLLSKKQQVSYDIILGYISVIEWQRKKKLATENREILSNYAKTVIQYANIGRSRRTDRMQAEISLALSESEVLAAENGFEASKEALIRLTGCEDFQELEEDKKVISAQPLEKISFDQILTRALENNPDIQSSKKQVDITVYENKVDSAEDWPELTLTGIAGYKSPDRPNLYTGPAEYYSVGLNLTIPLFSGLSSFSKGKVHAEKRVQAETDLRRAQLELRERVKVDLETMSREFERVKKTQTALATAREAMSIALREYKSGLLSSTDVVNLQQSRYAAENQSLSSHVNYLKQIMNLRRELGTDLAKIYGSYEVPL